MTKLVYLENTYCFEVETIVADIRILEDGRTAVLLCETIFYPQGGGQPCDVGSISTESSVFNVSDVRMDKEGNVLHIGFFEKGRFSPGDKVALLIDQARRIKNSKLHSAGHLVDCAVAQHGLPLRPTKGYHFSDGPYVEYEGEINGSPEMIQKLQLSLDELISKNIKVIVRDLSTQEAEKEGLFVPPGKTARMVGFEGFSACGCGGTHVGSTGEIGKIVIRKLKIKNGITRVCYEIV